ncbi:MAG: DUF2062 domain-containing protein [Deltaproteobacteria bacterium]|nr:DUF2062 domain-containing protein [Deltaproteobacteria bacterium]
MEEEVGEIIQNSKFKIQNNRGKNHPLERVRRWLKLHYLKLLRIDDPPERIARGVAIGVFIGIFPTAFLGFIPAFILAFILRANKVAAILGTFIMNPITMPFFLTLSATVGGVIFWEERDVVMSSIKNHQLLNGIGWTFVVYLVGNTIVSTVFAVLSYFITRRMVIRHRMKKAIRRERQL